ncbi:MAG: cyclic nucleotide-binding protein, partial [Deltaproteobacteria bacterium]|nr:cyclic nucleotide-binding protein [Deltaproteobacteria bacterium]
MLTENDSEPGISKAYFDDIKNKYLIRADLKKIDAGGGMIHGEAMDFKDDSSNKIVISHSALEFTDQQKEIGSGASFGTIDVLIPAERDYEVEYAENYLRSYFQSVPVSQINMLLNNPIITFNPETIIQKKSEEFINIFLVLTGEVEVIRAEIGLRCIISAGGLIGEGTAFAKGQAKETYRAVNCVKALQIPRSLYLEFSQRNGLVTDSSKLGEKRD